MPAFPAPVARAASLPRRFQVRSVLDLTATVPGSTFVPAEPEIAERFDGRRFTLHELEQRGVRIAGGRAVYTANGRDYLLVLDPPLG